VSDTEHAVGVRPRLEESDEFEIRAARCFDIPFSFSFSYCFSFSTRARVPGIATPPFERNGRTRNRCGREPRLSL